jgi:predicted PurR-regulated permease PerM
MAGTLKDSRSFELPWHTIGRVLVAAILVWCALRLVSLLLLVVVAIILALTLAPLVARLQRYGLPRAAAASLVVLVLSGIIVAFGLLASSSLMAEGRLLGSSLASVENQIASRVPSAWIRTLTPTGQGEGSLQNRLSMAAVSFVQALSAAVVVFVLSAILTLYLLIEASATYNWLLAFVPRSKRKKVAQTADECERVVHAYVVGNVTTSIFAAVFVFVSLFLLRVPGALLLAVLAGICDFVPVLGFPVAGLPAVVLAATISPTIAVVVFGLYVIYHTAENYLIAPVVYGDRLRLSNVSVILAFAVGAELAGVVGAVIALPIAAAYPAIERIWLKDRLGDDVIAEHTAIDAAAEK